jgi:hypothetical protein
MQTSKPPASLSSGPASPVRRLPPSWRGGLEVLLLERQHSYRDRVRGEYLQPWGVLEAQAVGLETVMRGTHAVEVRYFVPYDELLSAAESAKGKVPAIQDVPGSLGISHTGACQALADEAVRLGAERVSGVTECAFGRAPGHRSRTATAPRCRCGRAWSSGEGRIVSLGDFEAAFRAHRLVRADARRRAGPLRVLGVVVDQGGMVRLLTSSP